MICLTLFCVILFSAAKTFELMYFLNFISIIYMGGVVIFFSTSLSASLKITRNLANTRFGYLILQLHFRAWLKIANLSLDNAMN